LCANFKTLFKNRCCNVTFVISEELYAKVEPVSDDFFLNTPNRLNIPLKMEKKGWKQKLQAMGIAGFLFFLIKGIIWLFVLGAGAFKACT